MTTLSFNYFNFTPVKIKIYKFLFLSTLVIKSLNLLPIPNEQKK